MKSIPEIISGLFRRERDEERALVERNASKQLSRRAFEKFKREMEKEFAWMPDELLNKLWEEHRTTGKSASQIADHLRNSS